MGNLPIPGIKKPLFELDGKGRIQAQHGLGGDAGRFLEIAKLQEIAPKAVKAFGEKRFMRSTP